MRAAGRRRMAQQQNEFLKNVGSAVRIDPDTGGIDYDAMSTHGVLEFLAQPLKKPEERQEAYAALIARLRTGETLTADDIAPYRAKWIEHGANSFATERSIAEARGVLGFLNRIPITPASPSESGAPQPVRPDLAAIAALRNKWQTSLDSPFSIGRMREKATAALAFLAEQTPREPTPSS